LLKNKSICVNRAFNINQIGKNWILVSDFLYYLVYNYIVK
jgi:hypothetical protein